MPTTPNPSKVSDASHERRKVIAPPKLKPRANVRPSGMGRSRCMCRATSRMKPTSSSVQSFERPCRDDQRAGTLLVEAGMVREEQNIKKRGSYWQGRGRGRVMGRALMLLFQPLWNHCSRPCGHATTNPCRWAELRPIVSHAHSLEFLQPWIATIKPLGFRRASSEGTCTRNSRRRLPTDIHTFESPTGNAPAATAGRMSMRIITSGHSFLRITFFHLLTRHRGPPRPSPHFLDQPTPFKSVNG